LVDLSRIGYFLLAQKGATGSSGLEGLISFAPLILIFVVFYFLLIRPQQKKQQQVKDMLSNLKRGDRVITSGGMLGTIEGLTDTTVQLKIANQVKVKFLRSAIAGLQQGEPTDEE
jgi:preprotein translocase subunit YajC